MADKARVSLSRTTAEVAPNDPAFGLHKICADGRWISDLCALAIELPLKDAAATSETAECYVRGGDLVATYADWPGPAMRSQIYWRAQSHELSGALAAVELVVSVQTSLLDSCPQLSVATSASHCTVLRLTDQDGQFAPIAAHAAEVRSSAEAEPCCFLFRLHQSGLSYAEMVHPLDSRECSLTENVAHTPASPPEPHVVLRHRLFAERLEKGVILRARVLGVLLDSVNDSHAAARHYAAFLAEALPLTA